jgi:hypothetical protein
VDWAIAPITRPPVAGAVLVASGEGLGLFALPGAVPRATLVPSWTVVRPATSTDPGPALQAVTQPGFDPSRTAVLETDPGLHQSANPPVPAPGEATYRPQGPQAAEVTVRATVPSILLVRNMWAPCWRATLDERRAPVMPADFVDQGIAVPPGAHTIHLACDDPTIGYGLAGSAASVGLSLGCAGLVAVRRRRRTEVRG